MLAREACHWWGGRVWGAEGKERVDISSTGVQWILFPLLEPIPFLSLAMENSSYPLFQNPPCIFTHLRHMPLKYISETSKICRRLKVLKNGITNAFLLHTGLGHQDILTAKYHVFGAEAHEKKTHSSHSH